MEISDLDQLRRQAISREAYVLSEQLQREIEAVNAKQLSEAELYALTFDESCSLRLFFEKLWLDAGFRPALIARLFHRYPDRPKINMAKFLRKCFGIEIPIVSCSEIYQLDWHCLDRCIEIRHLIDIPVLRYENQHLGVYYRDNVAYKFESDFATFYNLEPDSPWHLRTSCAAVAPNKVALCFRLGLTPAELLAEYRNELGRHFGSMEAEVRRAIAELLKPDYCSEPELYGIDAALDGLLRSKLLERGYETAILTRMVACSGFDIEIIDVRPRRQSFEHLLCAEMK